MKKQLDFEIPFSGFCSTTFINCFASVWMYLECIDGKAVNTTACAEWTNGKCNSCGNCATKPQALQERFFFLFDTICGHSSLRCRYDGGKTQGEKLVNGDGEFYDGGSEDNIGFLFGFTGYKYKTITENSLLKAGINASIEVGKPVIVKLKDNAVPFAVVIGCDGDMLICPDFRAAQKSPDPAVSYDNIAEAYIIGEKTAPLYTLADGLKRIEKIIECNFSDRLWDEYMKKIGTYGEDSLGTDNPEGRKERMSRLAATMWHTFNCHNFAEVFRVYLGKPENTAVYDNINDVKKLADSSLRETLDSINRHCGYTHDLAWSIIGLDECLKWDNWKSRFYGDMLEVVILRIKENDKAILDGVKKLIDAID